MFKLGQQTEEEIPTLPEIEVGTKVIDLFPNQDDDFRGNIISVEGNYYTIAKANGKPVVRSRLWIEVDESMVENT